MGVADQKTVLNWLSQVDDAEPLIPQEDDHPSARFAFDGIPVEKQTRGSRLTSHERLPLAVNWQQPRLELESFEKSHPPIRPMTKGTESCISRTEKNGYERIARPKTKEDRYEYKGNSSRVNKDRGTTSRKRQTLKQKRKHTINEDFHASNVPQNRLTLHYTQRLGIFSKGKTSSPVKCCVVDQRFSETDFLSKLSAHEPVDTLRHSSGVNMFDYDAEIGHSCQSNNQLGVELLESNVEENHQQLPLSPMIGLIQDGTDMCHGSNNRHDSKANATFAPFRRPLNQSSRGEEQKAHYESLNACPRAEQTCFPFADPAYQYYTMQLLNFDLHTTEQSVARGPAEKYWTLEELKHLLQQRTSLRSPYEKGSLVTSTPQLQKCPRKRKHSPTEDSDTINAEPSRKSRVREPSQISDDSLRGTSTSPRTTLLGLYWFPGGFVDAPLNKRSIAHGDISDGTGGSSFQPQRPCRDRGASVLYDKDTSLISQTFDAAYEAIMRSERTEPHILPDYLPMENDSVGNNEGSISPFLQASWKWGTETLSPTHIGKEILSSQSEERELAYNTTGTNHQAQQPLDLEGLYADRQSRISVERDFVLGLGEAAGWNGPEATGLALDISPMRNFWRQNKLY